MPRLAGRVLLSNLKSVGSSWKGNVSGSCKTKRFPIHILTFGKLLKCSFPFLYFFFLQSVWWHWLYGLKHMPASSHAASPTWNSL